MRIAAVMLGLLVLPAAQAKDGGTAAACSELTATRAFKDTSVSTARMIRADAATKAPTYCEVTGVITPAPGSQITVVYRLPQPWNGKFVGLGGGGWAGNITLDRGGARSSAAAVHLAQGYATG